MSSKRVEMKSYLKNLAENHLECLFTTSNTNYEYFSEDIYKHLIQNVPISDLIVFDRNNSPPSADFKKKLYDLVQSSEQVFQPSDKNVYVENENQVKLPLVYDVLLKIYQNTTQLDRQHFFHEFLDYYYQNLQEDSSILTTEELDESIKKFLPYVKLEMITSNPAGGDSFQIRCLELLESLRYPNLTREDCYEIIRNKTGTSDYKFNTYTVESIDQKLGFLGDYRKIKISIELNGEAQTFKFFAKYTAVSNQFVKTVSEICFKKEEFVYHTFLPLVNNLGFKDLTNFAPSCYFIRHGDVIVLEDVSVNGFGCFSSITAPVGYEWLSKTIQSLAKFHACSILCEEELTKEDGKQVKLGELYEEYLQETTFAEGQPYGACMSFGAHNIYRYFLEKYGDVPGKLPMEIFKQETEKYVQQMFEHFEMSPKYRNVICHKDVWITNVLMKNDAIDKLSSCILVDYQLIRYCPPVLDLAFLFYMNTDQKHRIKYMKILLEEYYNELKNNLDKHDIDITTIFTFDEFLKSFEEYQVTGICQSLAYLQILLLPKETIEDINNDNEKSYKFYTQERKEILDQAWENCVPFRSRITELIFELYEICEANFYQESF